MGYSGIYMGCRSPTIMTMFKADQPVNRLPSFPTGFSWSYDKPMVSIQLTRLVTCPSVAGIAACDQSYSIQSGIGALFHIGWALLRRG